MQATAKIIIPDIAASMPHGFMQPHIIHPATLDALLQMTVPLFLRHRSAGCVMPVSIKEMSISTSISAKVGGELLVSASISPEGRRTAIADALAFQLDESLEIHPVISITQAELCATGSASNASDPHTEQNMAYQMEWGPDIDFLTMRPPQDSGANFLSEKAGMSLEHKYDNLERATIYYVKICLNSLSSDNANVAGETMANLLGWMRRYVSSEANEELLASMSTCQLIDAVQALPKPGVEGEALSRVGDTLSQILTGMVDPLPLLLQDDLLHRIYLDSDCVIQCCTHLVSYIKHHCFKSSAMTILEIGAGTGATTLPLLQSLDKHRGFIGRYDFTDISSGFFGPAQSVLSEWSDVIQYKTLDIEQDPIEQDFGLQSYDLVIASNVLHATKSLDITLHNVRKLMKTKGRMVLIELTRPVSFFNLIFGSLPGWWRGESSLSSSYTNSKELTIIEGVEDGRKDSPLLSAGQWNDRLRRNSFSGVEYAAKDFEGSANIATMMLSSPLKAKDRVIQPKVELLVAAALEASGRSLATTLSRKLESEGFLCHSGPVRLPQVGEDVIFVVLDSSQKPALVEPYEKQFSQTTKLLDQGKRILWINFPQNLSSKAHSMAGLMTGLARVARSENPLLKIVTLDVQEPLGLENTELTQAISDIIVKSFNMENEDESVEMEYAYRENQVLIPRLIPDPYVDSLINTGTPRLKPSTGLFHQPDRPLKLRVQTPGLLDILVFVDDESSLLPLHSDQIEVQVRACGINFKDVLHALGRMRPSTQMAGECAGEVTAVGSNLKGHFQIGDRICGWNGVSYASRARLNGSDACRIPDFLSFTTAASIPVIFMTAYYSLIEASN